MKKRTPRVVFKGRVFSVETANVAEPGGVLARRDIVRHQGSVAVLPVFDDGRIVLIRQYRAPFAATVIELVAGRIDPGETSLRAARRELKEEVGVRATSMERLIRILPTPGYCDETVTIYRGSGLKLGRAQPESDERIELLTLALEDALDQVDRGEIEDAKTVVALQLEAARRQP